MNEFWYKVSELEPPLGKNVWVTSDPFISVPKIRIDNWNGKNWKYHQRDDVYWACPINKKNDQI